MTRWARAGANPLADRAKGNRAHSLYTQCAEFQDSLTQNLQMGSSCSATSDAVNSCRK
jgi:hypothetical protein